MIPTLQNRLLAWIGRIGFDPNDPIEDRTQKSLLVAASLMFLLAGLIWGITYIFLQEPRAGLIPLSYGIFSFISLVMFAWTGRYRFFRFSQLALILFLPFFLTIALGGFVNSSAVILWSVVSPLGALLFAEFRRAPCWLIAYLCLLILSGFLQSFASPTNNLSKEVITLFFVLNIGTVSTFFFILLSYFIGLKNHTYKLLQIEQERSDALLLNVLPSEVALRLKNGERVIADHFANASILFADLVGFTVLSAESTPVEMVSVLNEVYSEFDALVEKHNLEKIRTMGDGYMVVSGVPVPRHDHAQALASLALEMVSSMENRAPYRGRQLQFRMGINSEK